MHVKLHQLTKQLFFDLLGKFDFSPALLKYYQSCLTLMKEEEEEEKRQRNIIHLITFVNYIIIFNLIDKKTQDKRARAQKVRQH